MIISVTLVVFLIIVFVLVFLFVNTIDKRKWLTFIISVIATPFVYFYGFYPMVNVFSNYHHEKYFDTDNWKDDPTLRYEMSDDLIKTNLLMGKTKDEVIALLGTNDWLSWNDAINGKDYNIWNYGLGIEPGAFNQNKDILLVTFENNKVVSVETYQMPILEAIKEEKAADAKE
jgi:hypothetical protein